MEAACKNDINSVFFLFGSRGNKKSPYGHVLLTPMTLRAKRPSGLMSFTQVTFHHSSWTPAKADEARAAREKREVLIRGRKEEGDFQKLEFGPFMTVTVAALLNYANWTIWSTLTDLYLSRPSNPEPTSQSKINKAVIPSPSLFNAAQKKKLLCTCGSVNICIVRRFMEWVTHFNSDSDSSESEYVYLDVLIG